MLKNYANVDSVCIISFESDFIISFTHFICIILKKNDICTTNIKQLL